MRLPKISDRARPRRFAPGRSTSLALLAAILLVSLSAGCSKAQDLSAARGLANTFMGKMARADLAGAYDMCDPNALSYDGLMQIRNNPELDYLWQDWTSLEHGSGGQLRKEGSFREIRLAPATIRDKPGYAVHFALREYDDGWKIMGFKIETE